MKKIQIYSFLLFAMMLVVLPSCKRKRPPIGDFIKNNCLKPKEVRENGTIVYTAGGANNAKPAYARFRIVFNLPNNTCEITETDGTVTKGTWSFTNNTVSITGLNPALTDAATGTNTRTTAEYTVNNYNAKAKSAEFTAVTKNLKVGDVNVVYTMVPCE